jgi:uncharacterized protein YcfL
MNKAYFLNFLMLFLLISCDKSKNGNEKTEKREFFQEKNLINVLPISKSIFNKEIISNGKLKSVRKSDLQFKTCRSYH